MGNYQNTLTSFNKKIKNLTGKRIGKLTVIAFAGIKNRFATWKCICECGDEKIMRGSALSGKYAQSCGNCHKRTHRMSHGPEHNSWIRMKTRCNNPNSDQYPNYGGRGIKICNRWLKFENFFKDMGPRPSLKHSLDRIDSNGNYEPKNCRWATQQEQSNNKRNNNRIKIGDQTLTVAQWARKLGLPRHAIVRMKKLLGSTR
jgi:hypothetical protein